jgi:ADP-heptose:LPS heptosyltransferase
MKETNMVVELYCIQCLDDTLHKITYINNKISDIECQCCHKKVGVFIDIKKELYQELLNRIQTKPSRITKEYKENLNLFLRTFPTRIVSKPLRLYKEAKETTSLLEKFKKKRHKSN